MNIKESGQEYFHLIEHDVGQFLAEWNIHQWRKEFVKVYQANASDKLIVRLIGWKRSLQSDRNQEYFLDIMTDKNQGVLVLPDVSVFKTIRIEIGVGMDKDFFPFFHSEDLKLEWTRNQLMAPSEKWIPLKLIDMQKWQSLSATYTYYGKKEVKGS